MAILDENVFRLDVAMDHSVIVRVGQCVCNLAD